MTEELLNTVLKLYESRVQENIWFADNIVRANGYDGKQASIIYNTMLSKHSSVIECVDKSRMFYTLLLSRERQEYEKQEYEKKKKNETVI